MPRSVGVLVSGGLDSCILLGHYLQSGWQVQPLFVRCGLRWETQELEHLQRFLAQIACPKLATLVQFSLPLDDVYGLHWSRQGIVPDAESPDEAVYLPGRNLLLVVKAAVWCQIQGLPFLALAPLGSNPFPDASDEFFGQLQATLNHTANHRLEIVRPFGKSTKTDVMRLGASLPLELTFSCIDPQRDLHCGRCNKCAERQAAFRNAEIRDPTHYAHAVESS